MIRAHRTSTTRSGKNRSFRVTRSLVTVIAWAVLNCIQGDNHEMISFHSAIWGNTSTMCFMQASCHDDIQNPAKRQTFISISQPAIERQARQSTVVLTAYRAGVSQLTSHRHHQRPFADLVSLITPSSLPQPMLFRLYRSFMFAFARNLRHCERWCQYLSGVPNGMQGITGLLDSFLDSHWVQIVTSSTRYLIR